MSQIAPLHRNPAFYQLLADSYARLLCQPLVPQGMPVPEATKWLYECAPFAVLAHNTDPDPLFLYGNKAAQRRFEYSWDEITRLPSRLSAEPRIARSGSSSSRVYNRSATKPATGACASPSQAGAS